MSSKQRDQIERAIDELRRSRPEVDRVIDGLYAMEEPLFIKTLRTCRVTSAMRSLFPLPMDLPNMVGRFINVLGQ